MLGITVSVFRACRDERPLAVGALFCTLAIRISSNQILPPRRLFVPRLIPLLL
jgi:hypothetical protein